MAFVVFGPHDWALYAANGLLAFAFFLSANALLRKIGIQQRVLCFIFLGTVPFMGMAVHEFRPDFAVSLLTAMGVLLLLSRPLVSSSAHHKLAVGTIFGLAMLVKPPVFPATVVFFFASLVLVSVRDRLVMRRAIGFGRLAIGWMICLIPFVLIPLPHYLVAYRQIWSYIYEAQFGSHRGSWDLRGTAAHQLAYFLTGTGGTQMLGRHLYLLTLALAASTGVVLARQRRKDVVSISTFGLILLLAYLIAALNPHKQIYFGLTFDILLAFGTLIQVGRLMRSERFRRDGFPKVSVAFAGVAVLGICFFRWPPHSDRASDWVQNRTEIVNGIYRDVVGPRTDAIASSGMPALIAQGQARPKPRVLLTGIGFVNPWIFRYMALKDSIPAEFSAAGDVADVNAITPAFDGADFIVTSESNSLVFAENLLSSRVQDELLIAVRSRPDFEEIDQFTFQKTGRRVYVFRRKTYG
jgi:4-amino-4-deoxy-L-arabinose transferase-like glycosyltransferase